MKTRFVMGVAAFLTLAGVATAAGPVPQVLRGPPGIAVAGSAHVIAHAERSASTTRVALVRDRDGKQLASRVLPGPLGVPAITFEGLAEGTFANGRRLVLASSIYDDTRRTRFVVVDTKTLRPLRTISLRGSYGYDALSPDGRRLYVLHYPGGVTGGVRYVVRSIDLRTGRLEPGVIVDKTEPSERMNGVALARAWRADRTWAYTLYNGGDGHAFVHALNTRARAARCIELPWAGGAQSVLDGVVMAVTRDRVLVLTGRSGAVLARIDTRTFSVSA